MSDRRTPPAIDLRLFPLAVGGTVLWLIIAGVLWLFADELAAVGREWWIDCALWGAVIGVPGMLVMFRHDRKQRKHRQD